MSTLKKIDHLVYVCGELKQAIVFFERVFGRKPDWVSEDSSAGVMTALFFLSNGALEIMGPNGFGPVGEKLKKMVEDGEGGLVSLAFEAHDIQQSHTYFGGQSLAPSSISLGESKNINGQLRCWRRFRLDTQKTRGVRIFILQNMHPKYRPEVESSNSGCVSSIEKVQIKSSDLRSATKLYQAIWGLPTRDKMNQESATHSDKDVSLGEGEDRLYGMVLGCVDIELAKSRMLDAGLIVNPIGKDIKSSEVGFTVVDEACNTSIQIVEN